MTWIKLIRRLAGAVALFFSLQGFFAVLQEVYQLHPALQTMLLFPAAKIIGDVVILIMERRRKYSFWEDWLMDTGRFSLLSVVALVGLEFWGNFLKLSSPPDLTAVAVIAYLLVFNKQEGDRSRAYELS